MERVGIRHTGGSVVVGGLSSSSAVPRQSISLSTFVIDRLPKAGYRIGRLKRRSAHSTASLAAASVQTGFAPPRIDDEKRTRGSRRAGESAKRKKKPISADPISAATTTNSATSDKNLLKLAQALENVYHQDAVGASPAEAEYTSILQDLVSQTRPIAEGIEDEAAAAASSSSPSTVTAVKKRRGRKPAVRVDPIMEAAPASSDGFCGSPGVPVVVKRTAGDVAGKRRLNLVSRIALRKRRQEVTKRDIDANSRVQQAGQDIWSEQAEKLITKYASSLDVGVVDWDSLTRGLLTAEEESSLALLMKPMKKYQKLFKTLSEELNREPSDEEWAKAAQLDSHTLRRHMSLGRAARNKLIQHNLRLVLFQAHKYHKESSSLSLFDLCQEGVSGLLHGVDKFDPKRGHRFSTYAVYWVRNSILRALTRSGSMLRSPYNVAMHKLNIKRARLDLLVELERSATDGEVMERLGLAPDRFRDIVRSSARTKSIHQKSLLTGEELVENIPSPQDREGQGTHSPGDTVLRLGMDDVLDSLKPRESLVLSQRFGLDGKGERTLGEIGRNLNLSREMVRRYEACGLLKMKHPTRKDYLRSYLV